MKQFLSICIALGLMMGTKPASAQTEPPKWSSRGVFAFGFGMLLDFEHRTERVAIFWDTLVNCSTQDYFCAQADFASLVLPKWCRDVEAGRWSVGNVVTEELAEGPSTVYPGAAPRRLLGHASRPYIVYLYDSDQVSAVFIDSSRREDLVSEARRPGGGRFQKWAEERHFSHGLVTMDVFGRCSNIQGAPVIPGVTTSFRPVPLGTPPVA